MVYNIGYRRPALRPSSINASISGDEKQKSIDESIQSGSTGSMSQGIPEPLSFDRIISGATCPPCTLRDFMNYLKYIEHDAENLQFYLWARSYIKKFSELPEHERRLSPEWNPSQADIENRNPPNRQMQVSADTAKALQGTGLEAMPRVSEPPPFIDEKSAANPFYTPPRISEDSRNFPPPSDSSLGIPTHGTVSSDFARKAGGAYDDAGLKWQPFTIQPFRSELARIITIYVADGSPRQLNLSSRERGALLHALEHTTHPSAFAEILRTVEWSLRCQAHPNFIRWTICNGNRPRVVFARGLGIGCIIGGIIVGLLITLSGAGRAWRVLALILLVLGIATLIAAIKGMCVVLHGMHHRHLRPWELFADAEDLEVELKSTKDSLKSSGKNSNNTSYESIISESSSNSYEDEPWVAKYQKRNVIRKIFDRELWVQEPALRQIQDTIFLQAILGGLVGGAVITAIFVAVPSGHFY